SQIGLTTLSPAGRSVLATLFPKGTNPRADLLLQVTAGADANSQLFMVSPGPGRADIQFGNDQRPLATPVRDRQLLERVDHNFSERDQFSARFMIDDVLKRVGGSTGFPVFDTGNYVHGRHSWRVGTDLTDQRAKQAAPFNGRGTLTYNASGSLSGFANYLDDFGGSGGSATRDFGSPSYYPSLFRQAYFAQDR